MDNKVLIGVVVAIAVVFLGLPVVINALQQNAAPGGGEQAAKAAPASAQPGHPPPMPPPGQGQAGPPPRHGQGQQRGSGQGQHRGPGQGQQRRGPGGGGGLNAQSLTNSAWRVNTEYGPISIFMNPGGKIHASHAMGTFAGTWSVSGKKLTARVRVADKVETVSCNIRGNQLIYQGRPLQRIR